MSGRYGHETGDELLKYVEVQIKQSGREEDLVARLGGDEFLVLIRSAVVVEDVEGNREANYYFHYETPKTIGGCSIRVHDVIGYVEPSLGPMMQTTPALHL